MLRNHLLATSKFMFFEFPHLFWYFKSLLLSNFGNLATLLIILYLKLFQNAGGADNNLGDPFFLQLPSTDKMSNTSVLFQPTGFIEHDGVHFDFFLRIVTNTAGTGTIQLDGVTINALQFKRVPNSGFYYYEARALNTTHNVQTTHFGTQFSVKFFIIWVWTRGGRGGRGVWGVCAPPPRRVCSFGVEVWGLQKHKGPLVIAPKNGNFFEFCTG